MKKLTFDDFLALDFRISGHVNYVDPDLHTVLHQNSGDFRVCAEASGYVEFSHDDQFCLGFGWIAQSIPQSGVRFDDDEIHQEAIKALPEKISFDEREFGEYGYFLEHIEFVDKSGQSVDSDEKEDIIRQISKAIDWKPVIRQILTMDSQFLALIG